MCNTHGMKTCTKCGVEKPEEDFPRDRTRKDGLHPWCKPCGHKRRNAWYEKNRETNLAYQAEWRKANPETKKAGDKRWREANIERKLAIDAAWRDANRDYLAAYFREHFQANKADPGYKAKRLTHKQTRRARELNAFVETVVFDVILQRDRGHCGICGDPVMENTAELDHVIPLAAGGTHEPENIQLAHRACNRRKGAKR